MTAKTQESTALAVREPDEAQRNVNAIDVFHGAAVDRATSLANTLSESDLLPDSLQGKPANVLVTILAGHELGLGPMASIRGIHIVKGKPVLSADMMVALVQRDSSCQYFRLVSSTGTQAEYSTQRHGHPKPVTMTYTLAEAHSAGLTQKAVWRGHPAAMLRARCASGLARAVYPDLLFGVYEHDEATEIAPTVELDEAVDVREMAQRIAAAQSTADLDRIAESIRGLQPAERDELRPLFAERVDALKSKSDEIRERGKAARAKAKPVASKKAEALPVESPYDADPEPEPEWMAPPAEKADTADPIGDDEKAAIEAYEAEQAAKADSGQKGLF